MCFLEVSSSDGEGSKKQAQSSAVAFSASSAASSLRQGEEDGSAGEPEEGFRCRGDLLG